MDSVGQSIAERGTISNSNLKFVTWGAVVVIDAGDVKKMVEYREQFQQALYELAFVAHQTTSELMVPTVVHSLYSPKEIFYAAATARVLQLTPAEGAASLAVLTFRAEVEGRGRTFLGRLKLRIPPRKGTKQYHHLRMAEAAMPECEQIEKSVSWQFAEDYSLAFEAARSGM
jgi:hypothetical protein